MAAAPNPPPGHDQGEGRPNENADAVNPGHAGPAPQPRPRLAPTEHSPYPGVDYTPPSRAPAVRNPGGGPPRENAAPREPAERGNEYRVPTRSEPARAEPAPRPAPRENGGGERERH
jgi:hypothetical protein